MQPTFTALAVQAADFFVEEKNKMKKLIIAPVIIVIGVSIVLISSLCAQDSDKKCDELKKEIQNLVNECKTCKTDEECFLDEKGIYICPIGCHFIRSHAYDGSEYQSLLETKIEKYRPECPQCASKCPSVPEQDEIGCRKGKCVDLRFYSEEEK